MLQQYLTDWANARKHANVIEEQKNAEGVMTFQRAEIVFQGVKIEIRNSLIEGTDQYAAEFFVPSTLKLIDAFANSPYPSTEFIATLLEAIDPNADRIAREANEKRMELMNEFLTSKKKEWRDALDHSNYSQDDIDVIYNLAENTSKWAILDSVDIFVKLMVKYQDNILDETIVKSVAGRDITAMDVLYDTLCGACVKGAIAHENNFFIPETNANFVFLDNSRDDKSPAFILDVKKLLRNIYADCKNRVYIFNIMANGLARFYEYKFNETIAYRIAKINERKEHRRNNRRDERRIPVTTMMNNISSAFDNAKPIRSKKSKKS